MEVLPEELKKHECTVEAWLEDIRNPLFLTRRKTLLHINGHRNTGKTFFIKIVLPLILQRLLAQTPFFERFGKSYRYVYLDLSVLAELSTVKEKCKVWSDMIRVELKVSQITTKFHFQDTDYITQLWLFFRQLESYWFIAFDNYHCLFTSLDQNDSLHMAATLKWLLLDVESPCYFILAGLPRAWETLETCYFLGAGTTTVQLQHCYHDRTCM